MPRLRADRTGSGVDEVVEFYFSGSIRRTLAVTILQSLLSASVALIVFAFGSIDVFTRPILPAALPDGLERIGTAAIGWLAVACGVLGLVEIMGPAASATGAREAR